MVKIFPDLRIGDIRWNTHAEGPGIRTALWVQGCSIRCKACCNPHLFQSEGGIPFQADTLTERILQEGCKKITILGGEPLDQSNALWQFLTHFKDIAGTESDIWLFTGYNWVEVQANPSWRELTALCDVVVAGPFELEQTPETRKWIGSRNQTVHILSERYAYLLENWPQLQWTIDLEITDDEVLMNGWPLI